MFDAADVVRGQSFAVELRLDLPVPPAGVVFLRGKNHGGVGRRTSEIIVAPMGRKPTGDSRVIHLQNQQQSILIVRANHHKYFPPIESHHASKFRMVPLKTAPSSASDHDRAASAATVSFSALGT